MSTFTNIFALAFLRELVANAACKKIPDFCEESVKKIARYIINSSPKHSVVFIEFCD
ncbi:hypothetical protein ALC53_06546 [Atta colombica]|uniref:Saposin B-type domain-containing protein n=1 Tax=Atta colombica TaxID=520822 RepID=A0A195BFJ3_9HYME|nr:hypothetical protein ALC53_06546 [Atta colombica]